MHRTKRLALPPNISPFGHGGYVYNATDLFAATHVRRPSLTGLLRDHVAKDLIDQGESPLRYGVPHGKGQNIAFVDGHVEFSNDARFFVWGPEKWPAFPGQSLVAGTR